jgi:hypothetical protein
MFKLLGRVLTVAPPTASRSIEGQTGRHAGSVLSASSVIDELVLRQNLPDERDLPIEMHPYLPV